MYWLLIVVVVAVILFLLKFKELRHKLGFFIVLFLLLFLLLSFVSVYKNNKVDLTSFDGFMQAGKLYFSWLGNVFNNFGKISSFVVKQDWGINVTNSTG